ncbi:hypothetical protein O181_014872 [Austropuccinia psidii MF-1]|uniref:Uncharacterized protein n=1 Tax=Austropuccinia psidii MF-1 TaxID=1389203 RepID=A0A9Q3C2H1_9BASI|nr:hypothetical protein [Austropuccinia psidii MF-1]
MKEKNFQQELVMKLLIKDFPETSALFLGDGIMSDSDNALLETRSNTYSWRSPELVEFPQPLDEAYCKLGSTPRSSRERRTKIKFFRKYCSLTDYAIIPPNIPTNWILPEALSKISAAETIGLDLREIIDLNLVSRLSEALLQSAKLIM